MNANADAARTFVFEELRITDEADGRGILRVFKSRGQAADRGRCRAVDRQAEHFLGQPCHPVHQAGAAGEVDAGGAAFQSFALFEAAAHQGENFAQPARNHPVQ